MAGSVCFIGLGNMGGPMVLNLVKAGFELVVHDINPARLEPLVAAGATAEASPEAIAAKCHRTICIDLSFSNCALYDNIGELSQSVPVLGTVPALGYLPRKWTGLA